MFILKESIGNDLLDSDSVTGFRTEVVELFNHTLVAIGVLSQRIDDPELTQVHGSGNSSGFGVAGDELDVLNTATLIMLEKTGSVYNLNGLTLGMVNVLRIFLESRSQRRRVSA